MIDIQYGMEYYPIGSTVEWHTVPYNTIRGTITSEPYFNGVLWVYKFNSAEDKEIIYVPHEMYGFTFLIN
jgi:hypothetical protein